MSTSVSLAARFLLLALLGPVGLSGLLAGCATATQRDRGDAATIPAPQPTPEDAAVAPLDTAAAPPEQLRARPSGAKESGVAGLEVGAARPIDPAFAGIPAPDLLPLTPAVERWRVVAGDGVGEEFERRRGPSREHAGLVSDRWGDEQTYELARAPIVADDGVVLGEGVLMPTTIAHRDRAATTFEPPLTLAAPLLRAGTPLRSESRMKVYDEGNRGRLQHSGRGSRTATLVDAVPIATAWGRFDTLRVRIEFRADLGMATVSEVATQYIAPGVGLVAEERIERVRAMGFINRTTKRTIVRIQ